MKTRLWLVLALLAVAALTACQPASPTVAATQPAPGDNSAPTQAQESPTDSPNLAYPGPGSQSQSSAATYGGLYPDVQDGRLVVWDRAQALILNGEVAKITLSDSLLVTLNLKDGRTLTSSQPGTDSAQQVLDGCGDACKDTVIAP